MSELLVFDQMRFDQTWAEMTQYTESAVLTKLANTFMHT